MYEERKKGKVCRGFDTEKLWFDMQIKDQLLEFLTIFFSLSFCVKYAFFAV